MSDITLLDAMNTRHSVRAYTTEKIEGGVLEELLETIGECNRESGLNIQLCLDEPEAFSGRMPRYGKFKNVRNYVALVGKPEPSFDENCGYYGEKIVLKAQQLGLRTCWVGLSYSKGKSNVAVGPGEKLLMVISIGYGEDEGQPHKNKDIDKISKAAGEIPSWFKNGVQAALLAPTAMNQQKFKFELDGNKVRASAGMGFYTKVDLGIAKYHFELGAGEEDWQWA